MTTAQAPVRRVPEMHDFHNFTVVKISDVPGFAEWLAGQTCPYVDDKEDPTNWAFEWDYERFIHGKPVID